MKTRAYRFLIQQRVKDTFVFHRFRVFAWTSENDSIIFFFWQTASKKYPETLNYRAILLLIGDSLQFLAVGNGIYFSC